MSDWPNKKPGGLDASEKTSFGKGVFRKCDGCGETLPAEAFEQNFEVCPQCGQHHKLAAARWRSLLLDDGVHPSAAAQALVLENAWGTLEPFLLD